jgi:polyisoprenoid-binding protein YceI
MKTTILSLAIFCFGSISSFARAQTPGVEINFKLSPVGSFSATCTEIQGSAKKEGAKIMAANIIVPLGKLSTGIGLRDTHMKEKYLEVQKFPNAELITGEGTDGKGKAKLKIHGVEKEVEGTYKVLSDKMVQAEFQIKLTDFNITGVRHLGVGVKDDVKVTVIAPISK